MVTEGNYLLLWDRVPPLLDDAWYIATPDEPARVDRLIQRHVDFGRSPQAAREWVLRSDERNAELIAGTADRADLVVEGYDFAAVTDGRIIKREFDIGLPSGMSRQPSPSLST